MTLAYRETAGGTVTGADYELKLWELDGFARRTTGKASNIVINANESGTLTFTERFVCMEWNGDTPPRGEVVINFAGPGGTVSQIHGIGPLTIVD